MGGYLGEAIRNDRYRMVRWTKINDTKNKIYELHDSQKYFLETENIADKSSSIVNEMESRLNSYGKAVYPQ